MLRGVANVKVLENTIKKRWFELCLSFSMYYLVFLSIIVLYNNIQFTIKINLEGVRLNHKEL